MSISKEERPTAPRARTLAEFLRVRSAKAPQFAVDLGDGLVLISAEDMQEACVFLNETPPALGRIVELLRASASKPLPVREAVERLAIGVVRSASSEFSDWGADRSAPPLAELSVLTKWARPFLQSKAKKDRARAEGMLFVAIAFLRETRRLDPLSAIPEVGSAYGVEAAQSESDQRPARLVAQLVAKSTPRQIAAFAKISAMHEASVRGAQASADRELLRASGLAAQLAEVSAQLRTSREDAAELRSQIEQLVQDLDGATRRLESAVRVAAQDINDLKARYRRVFGGGLKPVADDAAMALGATPPSIDFARDYLSDLIRKIDKEIEWLGGSSA